MKLNSKEGSILVAAVIFSFIVVIITASLISITMAEARITARRINSVKAFFTAEAGLERAIALYRSNIYDSHNLSGSLSDYAYSPTAATATYFDGYGNPSGFLIQISSTVNGATRIVQGTLEVVNPFTSYADLRDDDCNYSHDGDNQVLTMVGPRHFNGELTIRHGDNRVTFIGDLEATGTIRNLTGSTTNYTWNGTEGGQNCISATGELVSGLDDDHTKGDYYGYQLDWNGNVMAMGSSSPPKNVTVHGEVEPNAAYVEIPKQLDLDTIAAAADHSYGSTIYMRMVQDPASGGDPAVIDAGDQYKVYIFDQTGDQAFDPLIPSSGAITVLDLTGSDDSRIIYADGDVHIKGEVMNSGSTSDYNRATLDGRVTVVAEDDIEVDAEIVYAGDTLPPDNSSVTDYDNIEGDDSIALLAKDELHVNTAGSGWSDSDDGFPNQRASLLYGVLYSYNAQKAQGSLLSNGGCRVIGTNIIKNNAGSTFYPFKGNKGREWAYDWRFKTDTSVIPPGLKPTVVLKSWTEKDLAGTGS